jgi:hypothetical protein
LTETRKLLHELCLESNVDPKQLSPKRNMTLGDLRGEIRRELAELEAEVSPNA